MLLPYTGLEYYGPAAAAVVVNAPATTSLGLKGYARAGISNGGSGVAVYLKPTRLRGSTIFAEGVGALIAANPKGRAKLQLLVNIGAVPSAFDIAQAVLNATATSYNITGTIGAKINASGSGGDPWSSVIESGFTAAEILRLIAAAVQGNATGLEDGTPTFKGLDGATDRVTATYAAGVRTVTARDAS